MRILLDTGDYRCRNTGDVAMLQVAVRRLSALLPGASIEVLTLDEEALAAHCPGTAPVPCRGRAVWFAERNLLGRLHNVLPSQVSRFLVRLKEGVRERRPGLVRAAIRWRLRARADARRALDAFFEAAVGADVVVMSGAGGITDHARSWVMPALQLLDMANTRGVPTAIFGHGLGPLTDPEICTRAREVLPHVRLMALREGRTGPSLAGALGVAAERVVVTGDDAVELAYEARPSRIGSSIGVNVRVSRSAGVGPETLKRLRPLLQTFSRSHGAALLPVPISFNERHSDSVGNRIQNETALSDFTDSRSIRELLSGYDDSSDGGESLRTTRAVIEQVGRCRVVVTGAYHAAVFALSQGVSTVCLSRSNYFGEKLLGLADQFGKGCEVLSLDDTDLESRLCDALSRAWDAADDARPGLLDAARRQIDWGWDAYRRFVEEVGTGNASAGPEGALQA